MENELAVTKVARDAATTEHSNLSDVVDLICDELQVMQPAGMNTLTARAGMITDRACEHERAVLHSSVNWVFVVAHSHYKNIDLEALSEGYPGGHEPHELTPLEDEAAPFHWPCLTGSKVTCFPEGVR